MPAVNLASVEERLARSEAAPILVDPRLLRRIIKRHRAVPGLGLEVPHARCYAVRREVLLTFVAAAELGQREDTLPDEVILLPRPTEAELRGALPEEILSRLWRAAFHAAIHLEIERRFAMGALTTARVRERIHRIGETEFDEVRLVLRHEESLLPPYDDRETFTEFAALYLELRSFEPGLLDRLFPTLRDRARVDGAIDIDAAPLLRSTRPLGLPEIPARAPSSPPSSRATAPRPEELRQARAPSLAGMERLFAQAAVARRRGNDVRAALLGLAALEVAPPEKEAAALTAARADLESLAARLDRALRLDRDLDLDLDRDRDRDHEPSRGEQAAVLAIWTPLLLALARAGFRRTLRHTVEARLLFDLQSAAVARERPESAVDLVEFALSLGRRPIVRPLPAAAFVRVARGLHHAVKKLRRVRVDDACLRELGVLLHHATERAEENVRSALRPEILAVLDAVGLTPRDPVERAARAKLTEELLDQAAHRGFLGIGHLRDALSRNQLKLDSLSGPRELFGGDPLLKADRRLGIALDGVYRRAEIYLRSLQRISSVAFGTAPGRFLTRYLILPIGAAFVLLEGLSHLISFIAGWFGHEHVHLLNRVSLAVVSVLLFSLLHSAQVRAMGQRAIEATRWVLAGIFLRFPRFVASLPAVQAVIRSRVARAVSRYLVKPTAILAILWLLALRLLPQTTGIIVAAALFVAVEIALISPAGVLLEEIVVDWLARRLRALSHSVLPGLVRLIAEKFGYLTDLVERAVYTVDEWLRFREGQSVIALAAKALLGLGWFFVVYLIRIYVNLLIEPQINPIKHFPVVTVSHKLTLPMAYTLIQGMSAVLAPILGKTAARAIAGPTVLLLPGVFGFLVWELKENWKLYRSTRPESLRPAAIGHHGETMSALMKPGFHSGTLPKLYQKVRRAAQRGDESLAKHDEALREVEEAVHHFAERELAAILNGASRFGAGKVAVEGVELGSNRITLVVGCRPKGEALEREGHGAAAAQRPCRIAFEEQSGVLLASIPEPGWIDDLGEEERVIVENALSGLYHLAGVDVTREQLEAALSAGAESAPPYDIGSGGLVVWPAPGDAVRGDREYGTEVFYDFRGGKALTPVIRGEPPALAALTLESQVIFYRSQPVTWAAWVAAWSAASADEGAIPRVLGGASILPRRARGSAHSAA
jgi:hypothetical protein